MICSTFFFSERDRLGIRHWDSSTLEGYFEIYIFVNILESPSHTDPKIKKSTKNV